MTKIKGIGLRGINESFDPIEMGIIPIRALDRSISNPFKLDKNVRQKINEEYGVKSIGDDENDFKINKADFSWVRNGNSYYISAKPNTEAIPSGLYDIRSSMTMGLYLERRAVLLDELFIIPDKTIKIITDDIDKFWASKQRYEDYGITYKRGILIPGPPGTGKTSLINLLISKIVNDHDGIVLNMDNINSFIPMVHNIRALEPTKPLLAIIEDLDSFLDYNSTKEFLNLLDGNSQIDNVVYLATTNYINRIEPRIKNRPSRFDIVYEIGYPTPEARKFYIEKKLKPEDLAKINIGKWVADTQNMSFSHIRELICSVVVMSGDYDFNIERLKQMNSTTE